MRYYKAMVELGHVGSGNSRETCLYIYAKNISDAMKIAKRTPAVKRNKLPLNIIELIKEEFEYRKNKDPYASAMGQMKNGVS